MKQTVASERLTLATADGRELAGTWWQGSAAAQRSVVILPGMGVPQAFYGAFARFLAECGWGVLTFDYRGVARSRRSVGDENVTLDEWADLDISAAIGAAKARMPQFLVVIAHSIGGQLLGQAPAASEIDGALLIGAQRGIPRLYKRMGWCVVWYAYLVFPLLIALVGRLPVGRLTLAAPCPSGVILQWARWGRSAKFTDACGRDRTADYQRVAVPMIGVTVADDTWAPQAAVEALLTLYSSAAPRKEMLSPADHHCRRIGHFGVFNRHAPRSLWIMVDTWLRELQDQRLAATFVDLASV
jgi:predicted alpha/beta hydrolase